MVFVFFFLVVVLGYIPIHISGAHRATSSWCTPDTASALALVVNGPGGLGRSLCQKHGAVLALESPQLIRGVHHVREWAAQGEGLC